MPIYFFFYKIKSFFFHLYFYINSVSFKHKRFTLNLFEKCLTGRFASGRLANALAEEGDLMKNVKPIAKGAYYFKNGTVFIADFSLGIVSNPTVEQLGEALKASNYKAYDVVDYRVDLRDVVDYRVDLREEKFIGFATIYESKALVAIFDSLWYHTDAIILQYGIPVITDCSVLSRPVICNDIQAMNDSLTEGGGIKTVYYNDGRVEHYKAGKKKF